jgi:hypothetical protein
LIEEVRLADAVNNPHRSFELWDLLLYDKVKSEPNITLLCSIPPCSALKSAIPFSGSGSPSGTAMAFAAAPF